MTEHVLTPPPEPITALVSSARSTSVDIAKGLAITLVTLGHTAQGMAHREWWVGASFWFTYLFIYSFHMPAFFFVAGLFLPGSLQRRGAAHFVRDKFQTILYPYVLWMIAGASIEPLIGRFKMNSPPFDWQKFTLGLIDGDANWFLPVLFFCQILSLCAWKLPAWLRLGIALAASMMMHTYGPAILYKTVEEFCFLAAGMLVGRTIFKLANIPAWAAAGGAIVIFALQWMVIVRDGNNAQFGMPHAWLAVILGFTGTAGLFLLATVLDSTRFGSFWAWIGKASLVIFLLGAFAQGAVREVLLRVLHTHELWLQLLLPTAAATLLPAIVWHQQKRWRIGWLFRWPSRHA